MVQSHEAKPSVFIPVKSRSLNFWTTSKTFQNYMSKKNRRIFIEPITSLGKDDIVCTCEQKLFKSDNFERITVLVFIFWRQDSEKFGLHASEVNFS